MTSSTKKTTSLILSSEKEKSVYLRLGCQYRGPGDTDHETQYKWYVINTTTEENREKNNNNLTVFSTMPRDFPRLSSRNTCCVAWESIIYAVTSDVYYLDTRCPDLGWKKGFKKSENRVEPECAVLDGAIYVMGYPITTTDPYCRRRDSIDGSWVEVFDPLLNKSRFHHSRPTPKSAYVQHAMAYGDKKLLVQFGCDDSLYCYNVDYNSWTLIDEKYGSARNIIDNSSVVVKGILYCFARRVHAYDLARRRWFPEPVSGLDKPGVSPILIECNAWGSPERNYPDAYLVHVGSGNLCLVWPEQKYNDKNMQVHCTKFKVYNDDDGGENSTLHAIIESFEVYTIQNVSHNYSIEQLLAI